MRWWLSGCRGGCGKIVEWLRESFVVLFKTDTKMENRITINPEICHGKPTIRNSRLLVKTVKVEDIHACLNFAAQIVNFRSVSVAA